MPRAIRAYGTKDDGTEAKKRRPEQWT